MAIRGLEARALAGFIAYSGLPKVSGKDIDENYNIANEILELTKDKNDSDYIDKWEKWTSGSQPMLAEDIRGNLNLEVQSAEVTFLGVWDTVPGSWFLDYGTCKEKK